MTMRVKMIPEAQQSQRGESGIHTIIRKYAQHFPQYDMELVGKHVEDFDVFVVHAGMMETKYPARVPMVAHCHGLYWTAMYPAAAWEWSANAEVVKSMRHAHIITTPSAWVGETIQRDMHRNPVVVPHAVDWNEWQHKEVKGGYVIGYAKNRAGQDVCNPSYLLPLAGSFPQVRFMATFAPQNVTPNVKVTGVVPHVQMRQMVQQADVYISCVKETFGIGILEAMAAGLPILGWREGGIVDLVQHGVNGYLAIPGNMEDLYQGLNYCLKYQRDLGANGRELAKKWTWENVCKQLHEVYTQAIETASHAPNCGVIIPSYNYSEYVGAAIESVIKQTYGQLTDIVVVDDCSPDEGATERVVQEYTEQDRRVRYMRLEHNSGVAVARNVGIDTLDTKYICCLDADDKIAPQFLEACIPPLEMDQSLGISFTSMEAIMPNGKRYESRWPPDAPLFDQQVHGKNQVPTCCVFRREAWENLGGYRPRYAPEGCGTEDANLWLRMGANGWGATKASTARMFIYSLGGNTTSRKDYEEPNWLEMHPWTQDEVHPIASIATPKRQSHPAHYYDAPSVSIIIPVGPGHEYDLTNALDSLEAQDYRLWEAIVVLDGVDEVKIAPVLKSFPYARVFRTEIGPLGAGAARNLGAKNARSGLLIFLDADDYLLPKAITYLLDEYGRGEAIIYGDCQAYAMIEDPSKLEPRVRKNILTHNNRTGKTLIRFPAADYNCELAQSMPTDDPDTMYLVAHVTSLIPKLWHDQIGGFDEKMVSWEDVDWYWRLSRAGFCFRRLHQDIFMYQLASGNRREVGRQHWQELLSYIKEKYARLPMAGCRSCGGAHNNPPPVKKIFPSAQEKQQAVNDDELIEIEYTHPNKGQHSVIGAITKTFYGYRAGGERFLVRRVDADSQPMYFRPIQAERVSAPAPEPQAPPPPGGMVSVPEAPPPPVTEKTESIPKDLIGDEIVEIERQPFDANAEIELEIIPGITHQIARELKAAGLVTPRQILDKGFDGLQEFKGVGESRARIIIDNLTKKLAL